MLMSPHVAIAQLQSLSTRGQSSFLSSPHPLPPLPVLVFEENSKHPDCLKRYFIKSSPACLRAIFFLFLATLENHSQGVIFEFLAEACVLTITITIRYSTFQLL